MMGSKMRTGAAVAATVMSTFAMNAAADGETLSCPKLSAHRGASTVAPENTLPALVSATRVGAEFVEFDVRWTKSNVAVLMHDSTVNRTTGASGYVSAMWYSQIAALDAGKKFSPAYTNTRVPTFGDALRALAPTGAVAMAELKTPATDTQLRSFVNTIAANKMTGRVVVQSSSAAVLARLRVLAPTVPQAFLTGFYPASDPLADARKVKPEYWLPVWHSLTPSSVEAAQAEGMKVVPWTVDKPSDWEHVAAMGVDAIITNRAGEYRGWSIARCGK